MAENLCALDATIEARSMTNSKAVFFMALSFLLLFNEV